jgi:predicted O-methyltransferase YrrM
MEHYWKDLPGHNWFSAAELYRDQVRRVTEAAIFVELGCWKGRSTSCMGVEIKNSGKNIEFWAVDHWKGSSEKAHQDDPDSIAGRLFEVFKANIQPVEEVVHPLQSDTAEAARQFDDSSVDFVYVDAAHTYESVKRDLIAWWPKLKAGGVLAGDDWMLEEVRGNQIWGIQRAVSEFAKDRVLRFDVFPDDSNRYWPQWKIVKP